MSLVKAGKMTLAKFTQASLMSGGWRGAFQRADSLGQKAFVLLGQVMFKVGNHQSTS